MDLSGIEPRTQQEQTYYQPPELWHGHHHNGRRTEGRTDTILDCFNQIFGTKLTSLQQTLSLSVTVESHFFYQLGLLKIIRRYFYVTARKLPRIP
jgi:hypothetical protein